MQATKLIVKLRVKIVGVGGLLKVIIAETV